MKVNAYLGKFRIEQDKNRFGYWIYLQVKVNEGEILLIKSLDENWGYFKGGEIEAIWV